MKWIHYLGVGLLTALAALLIGADSPATPWQVDGKLYGKPKDSNPDAEDISGLACGPARAGARPCLIVDDESQGAQLVIMREGRLMAGDPIRLSQDRFGQKLLELDAEGVAYADGFFYVVGSHGRPRNEDGKSAAEIKARTLASRHLYRIKLPMAAINLKTGKIGNALAVSESRSLTTYIKAEPRLAAADVALIENGLTIEGLAVQGGTLILGFRGPVAGESALVLELPLGTLFDAKPGQGIVRTLALGKDTNNKPRGIRDLSSFAGGFVGIAGPVLDPADEKYVIRRGDYALFWWDGGSAPILYDLDGFGAQVKAEAIMPLEFKANKLRALLLFDGPLNGMPTIVEASFIPRQRS